MPVDPQTLTREHIEAFIGDRLHATNKRSGNPLLPATAADRYRILHVFFNWLVEIGELQRSPMEHMKHPKQKIAPPPVLTEDQLQAMLSTCSGPSFYDRRDLAILLVLMDTGMRLMELTNIQIEDIDWDAYPQPTILILGKGDKERRVAINPITQNALNMYINLVRSKHRWSGEPDLWLGRDGGLSDAGITYAIKQRAKAAGLSGRVFPHMFRHTFAHMWLRSGGSETDLCRICGWDDIQMVHERYGASAANARAQEAHQVHSPVRNLRLGGRGRQNRDQKRRR
jgi:site-specific recombinase XerD